MFEHGTLIAGTTNQYILYFSDKNGSTIRRVIDLANRSSEPELRQYVMHSLDQPAYMEFTKAGTKKSEIWYNAGRLHRAGAAAWISYYGNQVIHERWYTNGVLHRTDGPAIASYSRAGKLKDTEWIVDGNTVGVNLYSNNPLTLAEQIEFKLKYMS